MSYVERDLDSAVKAAAQWPLFVDEFNRAYGTNLPCPIRRLVEDDWTGMSREEEIQLSMFVMFVTHEPLPSRIGTRIADAASPAVTEAGGTASARRARLLRKKSAAPSGRE